MEYSGPEFGGTIVRLFGSGDAGEFVVWDDSKLTWNRWGGVYAGVLRELWHAFDRTVL
jgi:hypothetical protein